MQLLPVCCFVLENHETCFLCQRWKYLCAKGRRKLVAVEIITTCPGSFWDGFICPSSVRHDTSQLLQQRITIEFCAKWTSIYRSDTSCCFKIILFNLQLMLNSYDLSFLVIFPGFCHMSPLDARFASFSRKLLCDWWIADQSVPANERFVAYNSLCKGRKTSIV